jgi:hypothetical protein
MIQSRRISRFNGQLSTLEAAIDRAGVAVAKAFVPSKLGKTDASGSRRRSSLPDVRHLARLRAVLGAAALTGLVAVIDKFV